MSSQHAKRQRITEDKKAIERLDAEEALLRTRFDESIAFGKNFRRTVWDSNLPFPVFEALMYHLPERTQAAILFDTIMKSLERRKIERRGRVKKWSCQYMYDEEPRKMDSIWIYLNFQTTGSWYFMFQCERAMRVFSYDHKTKISSPPFAAHAMEVRRLLAIKGL